MIIIHYQCFSQELESKKIAEVVSKSSNSSFNGYNPKSNITEIINFDNQILNLIGKWEYLDLKKYKYEAVVTHCRTYMSDDKRVLEFRKVDKESLEKKIRNLTFQERGEKFVDFYTKIKKVIFINSIYNAEKKYYLYKLKFTSSFDVNRKFICYYLFGEKNNFSYYLALYFFDEENDEQHNQFLINTYNNN